MTKTREALRAQYDGPFGPDRRPAEWGLGMWYDVETGNRLHEGQVYYTRRYVTEPELLTVDEYRAERY